MEPVGPDPRVRGRTGLIIDSTGFEAPQSIVGRIRWRDAESVERRKANVSDELFVRLIGGASADLRRAGILGWLLPLNEYVRLPLWTFESPREEIASEFERRWRAASKEGLNKPARTIPGAVNPVRFTYGMLILTRAIYLLAIAHSVGAGGIFGLDRNTLVAFGAVDRQLVLVDGDWERLFTATFVPFDLLYLVAATAALGAGASEFEKSVGAPVCTGIFAIGVLGSSLAWVSENPDSLACSTWGFGAVAELAAGIVIAGGNYRQPKRAALQGQFGQGVFVGGFLLSWHFSPDRNASALVPFLIAAALGWVSGLALRPSLQRGHVDQRWSWALGLTGGIFAWIAAVRFVSLSSAWGLF